MWIHGDRQCWVGYAGQLWGGCRLCASRKARNWSPVPLDINRTLIEASKICFLLPDTWDLLPVNCCKFQLEMTSLAPGWPVYKTHSAGPTPSTGHWHKKASINGTLKNSRKKCVQLVSAASPGDRRRDALSSILSWVGTGSGLTKGTEGEDTRRKWPWKVPLCPENRKRISPLPFMERNQWE